MSASLTWRPLESGFSFTSGNVVVGILMKAFGDFPIVLCEKDIGKLEGIIACGYCDFQSLIDAIIEYDRIVVEAVY